LAAGNGKIRRTTSLGQDSRRRENTGVISAAARKISGEGTARRGPGTSRARAQQFGNADDRVSQRRIVWEYARMAAAFRKGLGETGLLIVVLALVKPLSPPGDLSGQLICGPIEA
jgi:hypothetical protein